MPISQAIDLLDKAKNQMKYRGIYALEECNTIEFVNIPLSRTQLKKYKRSAKKQGIKVYAND